jgi:uncharacterized protein (DUF2345 family)
MNGWGEAIMIVAKRGIRVFVYGICIGAVAGKRTVDRASQRPQMSVDPAENVSTDGSLTLRCVAFHPIPSIHHFNSSEFS